jgi:hypothetical protein
LGGISIISINDLRVIMDSNVSFTGHIDVTVGRALAMLGFVKKRLSCEFREPYTFKTLYVSLLCARNLSTPVMCGDLFHDAHIDRIDRVQKKFVRYALFGLGWTDMFDLPPYVDRCAVIHLETLAEKRLNACVMFIFDILSGRVIHQTCCL